MEFVLQSLKSQLTHLRTLRVERSVRAWLPVGGFLMLGVAFLGAAYMVSSLDAKQQKQEEMVAQVSPAAEQSDFAGDEIWRPTKITGQIKAGETLSAALNRMNISGQEAHSLANALRRELNLRTIRPGDMFILERRANSTSFEQSAQLVGQVNAFELIRSGAQGEPVRYRAVRNVSLESNTEEDEGPFSVKRIEVPVTIRTEILGGRVNSNLYEGILQAGGDAALVNRFSEVFGWQIDFYRDTKRDDQFKMVVEKRFAEGKFIGFGRVLGAEYTNMGQTYRGFFYESEDKKVSGIFDDQGKGLERSFLKSPLELARITSRYGQRFHPVLKRQARHNGIDYGASVGTPFWAVADGVVVEAQYNPSAGKMIRIRHKDGLTTEYFHASRFAPGIQKGARVKQKQVIGFVGTTGRSTGPHLHFGMKKNERYLDPAKQKFVGGSPVPSRYTKQYLSMIKPLKAELDSYQL